jgi:hypothetical protein
MPLLISIWRGGVYGRRSSRSSRTRPCQPATHRRDRGLAESPPCDELMRRLAGLADADPPLFVSSHPTTAQLVDETSPLDNRLYKHREDLIDALLCAWTAQLWLRHGLARCQVLGEPDRANAAIPSIIAPCRTDQRRKRHETMSTE